MAPLLGACGVLTFGGLVARLVGPRWAPLAALALALSLPEQFTSRSAYSEPVAQILFLGGFCLIIDSLDAERIGARVTAALGGLALGLIVLVRIDGVSDILPVIPYCGVLLVSRRKQAVPLLSGLLIGLIYGCYDGLVLSRPYLSSIKSALVPLALVTGAVIIATSVAVAALWRRGLPTIRGKWLPNAVALLAVAVTIGFAVRPYLQTVRAPSTPTFSKVMAGYQRANHLPVDPQRLYYEISLHWVFWYIGVPAVVLGTLGAALLSRRCLRGRAPAWTLPLMTFAWAIVTTLYQPGITPDQPWASRRLVPSVLPGFILLAVWASGWLVGRLGQGGFGRLRQPGFGPVTCGVVACCCAAVLLLPAAKTTFGLGIKHGGPVGIRLTADGMAFRTTYRGEVAAVEGMCAAIPRGSSVVIVDYGTADRLTQVVRGMCGDPAGRFAVITPSYRTVERVLRGIVRAGRRPVLLAAKKSQLVRYGGQLRQIMRLRTTQDESTLTKPPLHTWPLKMDVWMSEPAQ
jgi:hypothetical protein